jgi:hypothetical protein
MKVLGTILESEAHRTIFGMEYRAQWDKNPDAKSMDGRTGTALYQAAYTTPIEFKQGDRVMLEYRVGPGHSYGLWFIAAKLETK